MSALALVLSVALSQLDGGVVMVTAESNNPVSIGLLDAGTPIVTPFSDTLYSTCPTAPDAVELDGGWLLLPPVRSERVSCLMATCEDDRLRRKSDGDVKPPPAWWVTAISAAVVAAGGAFAIGRFTAPAAAPPAPAP